MSEHRHPSPNRHPSRVGRGAPRRVAAACGCRAPGPAESPAPPPAEVPTLPGARALRVGSPRRAHPLPVCFSVKILYYHYPRYYPRRDDIIRGIIRAATATAAAGPARLRPPPGRREASSPALRIHCGSESGRAGGGGPGWSASRQYLQRGGAGRGGSGFALPPPRRRTSQACQGPSQSPDSADTDRLGRRRGRAYETGDWRPQSGPLSPPLPTPPLPLPSLSSHLASDPIHQGDTTSRCDGEGCRDAATGRNRPQQVAISHDNPQQPATTRNKPRYGVRAGTGPRGGEGRRR